MHFAYRGFAQNNGIRQFKFSGIADKNAPVEFCFSVDIKLLASHGISLQETPSLCVQVLVRSQSEGEAAVGACKDYLLSVPDLVTFTAPRRALALAHQNKKPIRLNRPKPTPASQLFTQPRPAFQG